ncbi:MAG: transglutaminase-like domain-containing protein [Rhodospirillales bacterium]|nr:transglutaminase-like domain-containing protein [Rhodospirillales bacterium]
MKPDGKITEDLRSLGALDGHEIPLAETALILASLDRPGVALAPYRRHLERMVKEVRDYIGKDLEAGGLDLRIEALREVIAKRYGYGNDESDDGLDGNPDNGNLMRVIDRRQGLPVMLGLLYLHVAGAMGWFAAGLNFPGRFLVRLDHLGERAVIDPLDRCAVLNAQDIRALYKAVAGNQAELEPSHYSDLSNRDVLVRIQNNVKVQLVRTDQLAAALDCIETTLMFAPAEATLWREAGLLHARNDNIPAAVAALEEFLRQNDGDSGNYRTSVLLQELRGRLG